MLVRFFFELRAAGVPVSITEFLGLLEALAARVAALSADDFYYLARAALVKDERHYDRFDRVFAETFQGAERLFAQLVKEIPAEWLESMARRMLSPEERERIQALGGWQRLLETLAERLREQQERHSGGSKWIGTGGTSPFGADGFNPEGVRFGAQGGGARRAVKIWERREYRNFDDTVELGTRNLKLALRKLRKFAREGAAEELDLDGTIDATARNGGLLDLKLVPERHNAVKVLLFLDVGGSMDPHVRVCEELFSAARGEFKHLVHFYFHNFIYENLWQDNSRRLATLLPTERLLRTYPRDYRVILVGDATMSPYEIVQPGGSIEHWNGEAGAVWMQRLTSAFPRLVWLNPEPLERWRYTPSVRITRELIGGRMFPLTIAGLDSAISELRRPFAGVVTPEPPAAATPVTQEPPPAVS
ncbi:MAG TPA: VWA domain-containing protein [Steroidobacteraceae bacterium]|nr:VWA domain-containing protein [Steroidobacteraceae bacterium]